MMLDGEVLGRLVASYDPWTRAGRTSRATAAMP